MNTDNSPGQNFYRIGEHLLGTIISFGCGLVLLLGGIWILTLPLSGWRLLIGLPAAQLGVVVLVFVFDEATKKRLHPDNYHVLICPYCGQENLVHVGETEIHCQECQKMIEEPGQE
jgi:hypothetical protein